MPIYEYKGQQYDIATDDHAAAKDKILGYLAKQTAPAPAPADPNAQAGLLSGTTLPENPPPMGNRMVSEVGGPLPITRELPKFNVSKMPTEEEKAAASFGLTPEMGMGEKALRTAKSAAYGASTALEQSWLGGARMIADFTGLHQDDVKGVSKQLAKEQGAVEKTFDKDYGLKIAKNIGESVLSNVPIIYTGLTGGMPAAYSTMFGQSFLQTYDDSRNEGLGVAQSTARSALFGAAEVLGERIGLPALFKGIKDIGAGASIKTLAKDAANFVMKDLTGEELTYLSQYLTDMGFGLNPEASLTQFFQGAMDTALVTVGQGAVMGGAGMVTSKVMKELRKARGEVEAEPEEAGKTVLQQGKNVTVEGAPPTPPAAHTGTPTPPAGDLGQFKALGEEDIDEEDKARLDRLSTLEKEFKEIDEKYKTATPDQFNELNKRQLQISNEINGIVAGATTPPTKEAAPKAPEALPEESALKRKTAAQIALDKLKPEFRQEFDNLKQEYKEITAKQLDAANRGEPADPALEARQAEIQTRVDELYNGKQYKKPLVSPKKPNDPAIEKEALALADELEKVGDKASSNGLRTNITNMGGYTDAKKLDYYKGKLLEAQQKSGVAEEMPKETYNLDSYVRTENKSEAKRFKEFLPNASAEVKDLVAKSNQYLQSIADKINSKGYKVSDISGSQPYGEMRDLRDLLSGIAGSTFSYVKNAEHIAKNNRFANPEKLAKIAKTLEKDFANADKMLGKKEEEKKTKKVEKPNLEGTLENEIIGNKPEIRRAMKPVDMGDNTEYRIFQTEQGWTAALFDKDANQFLASKTWPFKNFAAPVGKIKAIGYVEEEKNKIKAEANKERQAKQREEAQKPKTELQKAMENEVKLESPTISKTSVIPHATVYVAPYKNGFVSSYQYYGGGKSQNSISTPLDLETVYTTRETAIKAAARKIRERAEEDNNKVALNWLETIAPKPKTVTLDTVSFELEGDKATIIYFLDSDGVFTREDKEVYKENPDEEHTSKLTFAQYKDEEPSWYSDETIKSMDLRPILVTKEEAQKMIAAERKAAEKYIAEEIADKEKEKLKTKVEVNKERQAKQKEKATKHKEKNFAVDDEGEKLSFPLIVDMDKKGYKVLSFDNPRTYENKGGTKYRTIEKDGVRLAFGTGEVLFFNPKYPNRPPQIGHGNDNQIVWHFLGVDPAQRNKGKATKAVADLMEVADKNGYTLFGEPAQLEEKGMTAVQLSNFYSKFGFTSKKGNEKIIVREPGAKEVEKPVQKIKDEDEGKPGSYVNKVVEDFAEKRLNDFMVGDDVRVGNTSGTVVGLEGDYIKFRPVNATNPKAYQRVQKKNVEFISRPDQSLISSASKQETPVYGTEKGEFDINKGNTLALMGRNMYGANLVETSVKELLQNSFDAVKGAVSNYKSPSLYDVGHIKIDIDTDKRTIKITDDARGMSLETVKKAFFTVAGSDKSDLPPGESSGGFGLAKIGFMISTERLKLDTVRDGVRIKVDATGEDIANSKFNIVKSPAPKNEHGTTVEVTIPKNYTNDKGEVKEIYFYTNPKHIDTLQHPLIGPAEVTLNYHAYGDTEKTILPVGVNFDAEATPFKTKVNFDWGSADVYFGVQRKDYPKHQILSSGVYQFSGPNKYASHFMLSQNEKIPYDIIVNVKPKVKASSEDYPFENSRESFKPRIKEDIDSLGGYLARVARGEEAKDLKESFEGIVSMPRVEVGEDIAEVSKKLKKVFDQRGAAKEVKVPEMPKEINIKDNVVSDLSGRVIYDKVKEEEKKKASTFKAEKEAPTRDEFMIEMTQDPKMPIFHNNTNVDYVEIGKPYGDPEKFFAELGTLMVEMKEEMAKAPGFYGYDILSPENLFFGGVSVDKGYGGVHIKLPYKGVFLNPFYGWGAKSLFGVRQNFLNTMIHEIAHTGSMDHGVGHNTQMIKVEQYLADQGLLDYYRDALLDILARHESTFTAMKEAYERSTTTNIAKSLEDINKGAKSARGDDSGGGDKIPQLSARTGQGRNEPVRPSAEDAEEEYDRRQEYLDQREADGRGDFKLKHTPSVKDFMLGSYRAAKEATKAVKENPMLAVNKMTSKLDRAITYARIKGIWYGRGLEEAEVKKFNGQIRDGQKKAISTVALTNALHAGEIMTQVIMRGKLMFDTATQMFRAADSDQSMAKVMMAKHDLIERVGVQEANNMIQDYFEAKRSRSILNAFVKQEGIVEKAREKAEKLERGTEEYFDALDEFEKVKNDFFNIVVARSKVKLSDESIDIYSALEDDNPELRDMMDNWQAVNKNTLDNLEFSGLISKKRAESLKNIEDYVPWQRIQDDMEDVHSAPVRGSTKSLTNVAKEKIFKRNAAVNKAAREYVDGEIDLDQFNEVMQKYQENLGEIDDIVDNMLHNTAVLGRNSMRNHAANMIAQRYAERYAEGKKKGKLRLYREEGRDAEGVRVNIVINGRRVIVNFPDPLIAEAVIGMENINMPAVEVFAVMSNLLRRGITTFPQFQLRQLFMDAPTAAMVSGLSAKGAAKIYGDTFLQFYNALNSQDPIVRHLKAYGIGGFQSYARSPEKELKKEIGLLDHDKLDKFTNFLDKIGDASDMAQRAATYKQVLAETGDETLALMRANNIIDFKKHGNAKLAIALTRSVSFMNAYAQQIDVLAEALTGGGLKGKNRGAAFASMIKAASMLTLWSLIYSFMMGGNDDYEQLDDQTKARNFVIPRNLAKYIGADSNILLPMNTSASFFFKAMPELIYNYVAKNGTKSEVDQTRFLKAMSTAFLDSMLGPSPIPTGIKPAAEIALNHNFFTGGTVTPKGLEGIDAKEQYNASTSELGKVLSNLTGNALNPIEMDHIVRGTFGTVGAVVMWGSNMLSGERPTAEQRDNPLWGGMIDRSVGRGPESLFYDLKEEVDPKYKTYMKLIEREQDEKAEQYFDKHEKEIAMHEYVVGIEAALKDINKQIRRVGEVKDPSLSKEDRRKEIQDLQKMKNEILDDIIEMRKEAGL